MKVRKIEEEWNDNCDLVKKAFGGEYPDFWFKVILESGLSERVQRKFENNKISIKRNLNISGKPMSFPVLADGQKLFCGFDKGLGEELIECKSLSKMKELYSSYASGMASRINWYITE